MKHRANVLYNDFTYPRDDLTTYRAAELQQFSFTGQPHYVVIFNLVVGSSAFFINIFIFTILLIERKRNANITELLMINQVSYIYGDDYLPTI